MDTGKHVFRPSRLLNVGPGLVVTGLLAEAAITAVRDRVLPPTLWLIPIVLSPLFYAYMRWLLKGCVIVSRDQVTVRGWVTRTGDDGTRRVYMREYIPRSQWNSLTIEGLLFPTVIWNRFGEKVVLKQVGQPRRFCRLLVAPADEFDMAERPSLVLVVLVALLGLTKLILGLLKRGVESLVRAAQKPHRGRQQPPVPAPVLPILPLDYEHFVAYCAGLCEDRPVAVDRNAQRVYTAILGQAHMLTTRANGHASGVLRPQVKDIREVTRRIPPATYQRLIREVLHSEPKREPIAEPVISMPALD